MKTGLQSTYYFVRVALVDGAVDGWSRDSGASVCRIQLGVANNRTDLDADIDQLTVTDRRTDRRTEREMGHARQSDANLTTAGRRFRLVFPRQFHYLVASSHCHVLLQNGFL